MSKIKVLHLIPTLASGGAERQLVDVVSNTSRENLSHTVGVLRSAGFFGPTLSSTGYEVCELGVEGKTPWFSGAGKFYALVKRIEPDIIHSWTYDADIVSRLVKLRNRRIPLITSLQTPAYEPETIKGGGLSTIKVESLRMIDSTLARLTDPYFVACSEFVARSSQRALGIKPSRLRVIYNSVDPETLATRTGEADEVRQELGIRKDAFVFLGIGRLDEGKGFTYILPAFQKVAEVVPNALLVIIGSGSQADRLRQLSVSLNIENKVLLPGSRRDIGACLEMADAFVFPTLFEGLGIVLLEAMTKELPCIATDLEVLREIVDNGRSGVLVPAKAVDEWAAAMVGIHSNIELRASLGAEAKKKVANKFYSEVLMPQWEGLYAAIRSGD